MKRLLALILALVSATGSVLLYPLSALASETPAGDQPDARNGTIHAPQSASITYELKGGNIDVYEWAWVEYEESGEILDGTPLLIPGSEDRYESIYYRGCAGIGTAMPGDEIEITVSTQSFSPSAGYSQPEAFVKTEIWHRGSYDAQDDSAKITEAGTATSSCKILVTEEYRGYDVNIRWYTTSEMYFDEYDDSGKVRSYELEVAYHVVLHVPSEEELAGMAPGGEEAPPEETPASIAPFGDEPVDLGPPPYGDVTADNYAADTPGIDDSASASVPAAIAVGALAAVAAVGAAGAAAAAATGGNGPDDPGEEQKRQSSFRMVLYKEFGNAIRLGAPAQTVYAYMEETTPEGAVFRRDDLTARISITSGGGVQVEGARFTGSWMGALVSCSALPAGPGPHQGVVRFVFSGEGGAFQNNVHFRLLGEPSVLVPGDPVNLVYLLAGNPDERSFPIQLANFTTPPLLHIETAPEAAPFSVMAQRAMSGEWTLEVDNRSEASTEFERFEQSYSVELVAESETERASCWVRVVVCYEGIQPVFYRGEKYIKGYIDKETGKMAVTTVDFRLGVWDGNTERLVYHRPPEDMDFGYQDDEGVARIIGLNATPEATDPGGGTLRYLLQAGRPFPSAHNLGGEMLVVCLWGERSFEYRAVVPLVPDKGQYNEAASLQEEFDNCMYIIKSYAPKDQADELMKRVRETFETNGCCVQDLQAWRHKIWGIARDYIEKEHQDYMGQARMNDYFLYACNITSFIGNIALDIVLVPVGGPLAKYLIQNGKNLIVTILGRLIAGDSLSMNDLSDYIIQTFGTLDELSPTPKPTEYGRLAMWLILYFAYRFFYHALMGKDSEGKSLRWIPAGLLATAELGSKALVMGFAARFVTKADVDGAFPKGQKALKIDKYSKGADELAMKPITDLGDKVLNAGAPYLDKPGEAVADAIAEKSQAFAKGAANAAKATADGAKAAAKATAEGAKAALYATERAIDATAEAAEEAVEAAAEAIDWIMKYIQGGGTV